MLFSYFNPLLNHGLEKLAGTRSDAGFDGVLASDLTVEESEPFVRTMRRRRSEYRLSCSADQFAGTDEEDCGSIDRFLYAVSRTGVTGEQQELAADLREFLQTLCRSHATSPIAVGFGISSRSMCGRCGRKPTALSLAARS